MIIAIILLILAVLATAVSLTLFAVMARRDRDSSHNPQPDALAKLQRQAVPQPRHHVPSRFAEPFSQQPVDLWRIGLYEPILKYADVSLMAGNEAVQSYQQSEVETLTRQSKRVLRETSELQELNETHRGILTTSR